jgi:hypothetical protein
MRVVRIAAVLLAVLAIAPVDYWLRLHVLYAQAPTKSVSALASKVCYVYQFDMADEIAEHEVVSARTLPSNSTVEDCEKYAEEFPPAHKKERTYISLGCSSPSGISIGGVFAPLTPIQLPANNSCRW